jgi:hypothetical protein
MQRSLIYNHIFAGCTSISSITINVGYNGFCQFLGCFKLSILHLIWKDNVTSLDLRSLLPDTIILISTTVYKQIRYIDLRMFGGGEPSAEKVLYWVHLTGALFQIM